jgi:Ni/Fe-hydrogenase subunit HybB-like protein
MIPAVYGEVWTVKELLVLPNEFIYWSIQVVMYPFMTGLVAGSFILSSLYHVFGVKALKGMSRFALVFSFALLPAANLPPLLFLQSPERAHYIFITPHFSSAIAAFGLVVLLYAALVAAELWFIYRPYFVESEKALKGVDGLGLAGRLRRRLFGWLTLGARDIGDEALRLDTRAVKLLAAIGIPVACVLHGYAGFIFGTVKANAVWMTPLMPIIFIVSAVVSGIALCILCYAGAMEIRKLFLRRRFARLHPYACSMAEHRLAGIEEQEVRVTSRYLVLFILVALVLELLDIIFRGYTAMKSWEIMRQVVYGRDFFEIFILQHALGRVLPLVLLLLPGLTVRRTMGAAALVLLGVFMMRWNVVIGGQSISLSAAGFIAYDLPVVPRTLPTLKEGVAGALLVFGTPFVLFWLLNKIFPVFIVDRAEGAIKT